MEDYSKVLYYFNSEYHWTEEELRKHFGQSFDDLLAELKSLDLNNPQEKESEKLMIKRIDNFMMDEQVLRKKRTM